MYLTVCPLHRPGLIPGRGGIFQGQFPNDASWEAPSQGRSRPISAPLLTVALSWRHEKTIVANYLE